MSSPTPPRSKNPVIPEFLMANTMNQDPAPNAARAESADTAQVSSTASGWVPSSRMPFRMQNGDQATPTESTLQEAHRLTHGPRRSDYGHPLDDYTRTAGMVSALLAHKLKEPLTAEDITQIMQCVKMSRHANAPKRDNMVDAAGYAWATWEIKEERDRRSVK